MGWAILLSLAYIVASLSVQRQQVRWRQVSFCQRLSGYLPCAGQPLSFYEIHRTADCLHSLACKQVSGLDPCMCIDAAVLVQAYKHEHELVCTQAAIRLNVFDLWQICIQSGSTEWHGLGIGMHSMLQVRLHVACCSISSMELM